MAAPMTPSEPVLCDKCGDAMERVESTRTPDETEQDVRWICGRCGHETSTAAAAD